MFNTKKLVLQHRFVSRWPLRSERFEVLLSRRRCPVSVFLQMKKCETWAEGLGTEKGAGLKAPFPNC